MPLVLIDRDDRIVAANAAVARNAGLPAADIVGRRCHEVSLMVPFTTRSLRMQETWFGYADVDRNRRPAASPSTPAW